MLEVETLDELRAHVGRELGTSEWVAIDQARIDAFARITGDDNWIHVDVARAARELPGGKTIAHGMLTLSLVTHLGGQICRVRQRDKGINYGSNKVRFTAPVTVGSRIRLHRTLQSFDPVAGGARLTFGNTMEIEGESKPALVAETVSMIYAPREPS
ncbi:MaoC family dehydratase [Bordetella petrii]|uniref:MaoC family dehydratase n=1 Tax=Bordetella petrii TaxID=94624 RepID=UPI001E59019F|nr:MaoC family dehydratase [Bordetella petrii]MCD0501459.1 MaoC family dehydratase [Bordetella petrii]